MRQAQTFDELERTHAALELGDSRLRHTERAGRLQLRQPRSFPALGQPTSKRRCEFAALCEDARPGPWHASIVQNSTGNVDTYLGLTESVTRRYHFGMTTATERELRDAFARWVTARLQVPDQGVVEAGRDIALTFLSRATVASGAIWDISWEDAWRLIELLGADPTEVISQLLAGLDLASRDEVPDADSAPGRHLTHADKEAQP